MTAKVRTEKFYSGHVWEASLPDGWTFRQDRAVRGFPYVFESSPDCRMQIGTTRDTWINYGKGVTRAGIATEEQRVAYVQTIQSAWMSHATTLTGWLGSLARRAIGMRPAVRMHALSGLVGFTHPVATKERVGWAGWFSAAPWSLYVRMTCPPAVVDEKTREAMAILDSVRFLEAR